MNAKEKYLNLKDVWIKARGEERDSVQHELDHFFASLTEEEKNLVCEAVSEDFVRLHKVAGKV